MHRKKHEKSKPRSGRLGSFTWTNRPFLRSQSCWRPAGARSWSSDDRYLNPQMGRILRTLGFDRVWAGGEGAHLIDGDGRALPRPVRRLRRVRDRAQPPRGDRRDRGGDGGRTGNLPQLGVTLLAGCSPSSCSRARRRASPRWCRRTRGTEAVEAAIKIARAATGRPRVLYAEHAFHGLTLGVAVAERRRGVPRRLRSPAGRLRAGRRSAIWRRSSGELARGDVAAFVVEPVQGKGVNLPPPDYLRARSACAGRRERCSSATRCRRASGVPGGSSRSSTGISSRTSSASRRPCRAGSCRSVPCSSPGRRSTPSSTAWSARFATDRRSAATTSPPPRRSPRCGCSTRSSWWRARSGWARCCSS